MTDRRDPSCFLDGGEHEACSKPYTPLLPDGAGARVQPADEGGVEVGGESDGLTCAASGHNFDCGALWQADGEFRARAGDAVV